MSYRIKDTAHDSVGLFTIISLQLTEYLRISDTRVNHLVGENITQTIRHVIHHAHHRELDASLLGERCLRRARHANDVEVVLVQADLRLGLETGSNGLEIAPLGDGVKAVRTECLDDGFAQSGVQN